MRVLFIQRDPFVALGLMSLTAFLKKKGHVMDVLVTSMEKDWLKVLANFKPGLVALPCTTGAHTLALKLAGLIKECYPDLPILLGGNHPTFYPKVIHHPSVDIIALGEAEYAMLELLDRIERGQDYSRVKNLHVKVKGKVFKNPMRPLEQDLDKFPFPDRNLYAKYDGLQQMTHYRIITTRGCPYDCSFCYNVTLKAMYSSEDGKGRYVRRRSVRNVIEELKVAKENFGIQGLEFQDDIFTLYPHAWLFPFLELYQKEVGLPFTCCIRPDLVNEAVVKALKKAGCHGLMMGLEAANEEINNKVLNRELSKQSIIEGAAIVKKHGVRLKTFSMLGSPGETLETAFETLELNQRIKPDFPRCSLTQPYPNSPLMGYCVENNLLEDDFNVDKFERSFFMNNPVKFKNKQEVLRLQKVFGLCVRWPALTPVARHLIKMKRGDRLFDLLFKIDYAYMAYRFYDYNLFNFLKVGLRMKDSFLSRKKQAPAPV